MESHEDAARRIFGERASFYTTSSVHTDPEVLARVVELTRPTQDAIALDRFEGVRPLRQLCWIADVLRRVQASNEELRSNDQWHGIERCRSPLKLVRLRNLEEDCQPVVVVFMGDTLALPRARTIP